MVKLVHLGQLMIEMVVVQMMMIEMAQVAQVRQMVVMVMMVVLTLGAQVDRKVAGSGHLDARLYRFGWTVIN